MLAGAILRSTLVFIFYVALHDLAALLKLKHRFCLHAAFSLSWHRMFGWWGTGYESQKTFLGCSCDHQYTLRHNLLGIGYLLQALLGSRCLTYCWHHVYLQTMISMRDTVCIIRRRSTMPYHKTNDIRTDSVPTLILSSCWYTRIHNN